MAQQDFVPAKDGDFLAWDDNLIAQLAGLATKYNITAAQLTAASNENASLHTDNSDSNQKKAASQSATTKWRTTRRTVTGKRRAMIRQIKAHSDYVAADGELLGGVGPEDTTDLTSAAPTLTVRIITMSDGSVAVEVGFNKSISDGVQISSKRGNETTFSRLATDGFSPYVDNRPNLGPGPETRQYQAVYILGDDPIGNMSATVGSTVSPGVAPVGPA
jgi:hypothetical protein